MIFGNRHAFIALGRDCYGNHHCHIEIGLGARANPPLGELAYRGYFRFAWDWLPDVVWDPLRAGHGGVHSSAWTGRETSVWYWRWRRALWLLGPIHD